MLLVSTAFFLAGTTPRMRLLEQSRSCSEGLSQLVARKMTCHSFNCFSTVWGQGNAPLVTSDCSAFQAVTLEENYLTPTLKIVAQPYSKVPGILVQKAPLQDRADVLKLYPSSGKNVIIMVCLYLKEHFRGCYVSSSALSHTFASVV